MTLLSTKDFVNLQPQSINPSAMSENQNSIMKMFTEIKDYLVKNTQGKKKDVALVLSSGGARGLAHIGAIEELESRGYHIKSIAGTSMGALVAGMYATGHLETYREWMKGIDKQRIRELTDYSPSLDHLVQGKKIIDTLKELVPDCSIDDLSIPYSAIATDWESGHEVVFTHGSLYDAIRASISLPAFFSPVRTDGKILIDGGTTNPLPLNRVARQPGDLLVAVNVCGRDYKAEFTLKRIAEARRIASSRWLRLARRMLPGDIDPDFNYFTLLNRTASIMIHQNAQLSLRLTPPDILLDLPMRRYGGFDYDKSERIIAIGRERMAKVLDQYEGKKGR